MLGQASEIIKKCTKKTKDLGDETCSKYNFIRYIIRLMTSQKLNWIECSEDVCFWTHFHRVILINKTSKDENETNIDIETEIYLKILKKNVILIHQNKAEIGE